MSSRRARLLRASSALALAAAVAGCSNYVDHNDTVSASAGDAVDANIAIQTIDPWPYAASKTEILSDGHTAASATGTATAATGAAAAPIMTTPAGAGQSAPSE